MVGIGIKWKEGCSYLDIWLAYSEPISGRGVVEASLEFAVARSAQWIVLANGPASSPVCLSKGSKSMCRQDALHLRGVND